MRLMTSRRSLLAGATALIPVALLGACAGQTATQVTQQAVTYAADIANGLAAAAAGLQGVPAATLAAITAAAKDAVTAAGALNTALTQTAAQPVVQQIQTDAAAVISAVQGMTLPSAVQTILADVQVVLPILLGLVGLIPALTPKGVNYTAAAARLHALPRVTP